MVMFLGRTFARLLAFNMDSLAASTAFAANSRFVPASLPVGRQKWHSGSSEMKQQK